jgi:hypothetical protein
VSYAYVQVLLKISHMRADWTRRAGRYLPVAASSALTNHSSLHAHQLTTNWPLSFPTLLAVLAQASST